MKNLPLYNDSDVGYMDEDFLELEIKSKNQDEDNKKIVKESEEEHKEI